MDLENYFAERLSQLRGQRGVSARDMSLSMGQSPGYINKIESKQSLPSMTGFFYICEYLNITPGEFFNDQVEYPFELEELCIKLRKLNKTQLDAVKYVVDAFLKKEWLIA